MTEPISDEALAEGGAIVVTRCDCGLAELLTEAGQ